MQPFPVLSNLFVPTFLIERKVCLHTRGLLDEVVQLVHVVGLLLTHHISEKLFLVKSTLSAFGNKVRVHDVILDRASKMHK